MRKRMMMILMAALVVMSLGVVAMAAPDNASQLCKANGDFGVSHDTCVICVNSGALDTPPSGLCACKLLEDFGELEEAGFANVGQCVASGFTFDF